MPRSGPRKVRKYSDEFNLTAVRLSQQPGLQATTSDTDQLSANSYFSGFRRVLRSGMVTVERGQLDSGDIVENP